VDEIMRSLQGAFAQAPVVRFRPLSMRMDLVAPLECERGCSRPPRRNEIEEIVMAKVIEFYVPKRFQRPFQGASQAQSAKVIEFCSQTRKSA